VLSTINNLHQQLYNIGYKNSNEPLTENPRHIRRYVGFNPPSQKTSTLLISQLNNETIRKELIDYNEDLNKGLIEMNEFISIVKDNIRPYLGQKEVYNLSSQFEALDANDVNMLSKNDLIKISKNSDFQQLIFEANFKLKSIINGLKNKLLTQNNSLRSLIINELKAY
jgi:Ca2+-binding EF-hand superfamily protein